ncbi:MAG: hypothetical protein KF729_06300 [Sandaracinaceae bacterium]|nr:hypothetical protein [Sandaracinaceae bacterium]
MEDELGAHLDDAAALDHALARAPRALAPRLVASLAPALVEAARDALGRSSSAALFALGRPALWVATAALIDALPGQRAAPWPPLERWDALVEVRAGHPETAWLVADVLAALAPEQAALARRVVLGVERRFGPRGWAALAARAGAGPHAVLLTRPAG